MAREILGEFGPERSTGPASISGGVKDTKDVHNYQTPKGPSNVGDPKSPGLHGDTHPRGTQGRY
jgi:hypothetical protein